MKHILNQSLPPSKSTHGIDHNNKNITSTSSESSSVLSKANSIVNMVGRLSFNSLRSMKEVSSDSEIVLEPEARNSRSVRRKTKSTHYKSRRSAIDPDSTEYKLSSLLKEFKEYKIDHRSAVKISYYMLECRLNDSSRDLYKKALSALEQDFSHRQIENFTYQAKSKIPLLKDTDDLLQKFHRLLDTSVSEASKLEILNTFKVLREAATSESRDWVNFYAEMSLEYCMIAIAPPKNNEHLNDWRRKYDKLLPLFDQLQLTPVDFAPPDIQKSKGVNVDYYYTNDDIEALLSLNLSQSANLRDANTNSINSIEIAPSLDSTRILKSKIFYWLNETVFDDHPGEASLLVVPYCPVNSRNESTQHWVGLILSKDKHGLLEAGYIDTLSSKSKVPSELVEIIHDAIEDLPLSKVRQLASFNRDNLITIKHNEQGDYTSCGSILAHDLTQVIQGWKETKLIPSNTRSNKTTLEIRRQQLEDLGGIASDFGIRQMWDLHFDATLNANDFHKQDMHIINIVKAMNLMSQENLHQFIAEPKIDLISQNLPYQTTKVLKQANLALSPLQLIERAYKILVPAQEVFSAVTSLSERNPVVGKAFKKVIISIIDADEDFNPAQAIAYMRSLVNQYKDELGNQSEQTQFIKTFFPDYDPVRKNKMDDLSMISIESIQMVDYIL